MLHRHAKAACVGAAAAAALVLTSLQGAASAQPAGGAAPSAANTLAVSAAQPELLRAMQRDLGLTRAEAERRLVNEAEAGATAAVLRQRLGDSFAGAWVEGADSGTLTVATTRAADAAAIRAGGAEARLRRRRWTGPRRATPRRTCPSGTSTSGPTPSWSGPWRGPPRRP
jgi:streptogrisin C